MISNYADLLLKVFQLASNDDNASALSVPANTMRTVIALAEKRVYRDVRSRHNEKAFAITVTGNLAALPADFEAASVVHFGKLPLQPVSEEFLLEYLNTQPSGQCRYFAEAGTSFIFAPAVADATVTQGRYYFRFADLDETTFSANTLLAKEPDLFIYAALMESAPFFTASAQLAPLWSQKYEAIKDRINTEKQRAATNAGRASIRPSTRLMG